MLELDPWKRIDRGVHFEQPEAFFEFGGFVAQTEETLPESLQFSADKIMNVQMIQKKTENAQVTYTVLILQYVNCIATAAINRNGAFFIHCPPEQMI